jgi:hypothetical protein
MDRSLGWWFPTCVLQNLVPQDLKQNMMCHSLLKLRLSIALLASIMKRIPNAMPLSSMKTEGQYFSLFGKTLEHPTHSWERVQVVLAVMKTQISPLSRLHTAHTLVGIFILVEIMNYAVKKHNYSTVGC